MYKRQVADGIDGFTDKNEANIQQNTVDMKVIVNGTSITLTGKTNYVFVDIFDKYEFDLKNVRGTQLIQRIDGRDAQHFSPLHQGAVIDIYWKE